MADDQKLKDLEFKVAHILDFIKRYHPNLSNTVKPKDIERIVTIVSIIHSTPELLEANNRRRFYVN